MILDKDFANTVGNYEHLITQMTLSNDCVLRSVQKESNILDQELDEVLALHEHAIVRHSVLKHLSCNNLPERWRYHVQELVELLLSVKITLS